MEAGVDVAVQNETRELGPNQSVYWEGGPIPDLDIEGMNLFNNFCQKKAHIEIGRSVTPQGSDIWSQDKSLGATEEEIGRRLTSTLAGPFAAQH